MREYITTYLYDAFGSKKSEFVNFDDGGLLGRITGVRYMPTVYKTIVTRITKWKKIKFRQHLC